MQDRIQLKREEVVGEGVALSDINPVTNTKSVDDDSAGVPLDVTIERLWQAINNSLSRVVNSVNGRSGIVVVTADDVGLGNVTNVSYGTIQEWVIKELADQFGIKHLMLFDTEAEMNAAMEGWRRDTGHANVPFYIRNNSTEDMRSFIGYFAWDDATAMLVPVKKAIDTIGYADNSIIYNESINGRALGNGGIGVNIWSGEDALKIYNASAIKSQSGLMIDKDKIAPHVYFYNGAYGNDASEGDLAALVYTDDGVTTATTHKLRINVKGITMTDPTVDTCQTFKKNDIIVCNFSDNGYRNNDGSLKSNVVPELVCRESMIGTVISVPDGVDPSSPYVIDFFPIKPYVGMGLKYYEVHTDATTNKKSTMIGIDLLTGKMTSAFIDANVSGINAFSSPDRYDVTISDMKTNHTVTPVGRFSTSISGSNSAFISPDFSMNIVPSNIFGNTTNSPITNWPPKTPGESTNGNSRPIGNQSFVGVNLLKKVDTTNKTAYNMSGLRIIDPLNSNDTITNNVIGKSDNDTTDKFATDAGTTSGGLMVNVGKFLEIGTNVGDDATRYDGLNGHPQYYAGGKVNVRVSDKYFTDDSDNRLDLRLSHFTTYTGVDTNTELGGGIVYTPGIQALDYTITPGLTINRGLGLRMSHYDRFGHISDYYYEPVRQADFTAGTYYIIDQGTWTETTVTGSGTIEDPYTPAWIQNTFFTRIPIEDKGHLAVSVFDKTRTADFPDDTAQLQKKCYGGLRYVVSDHHLDGTNIYLPTSGIGLRVNDLDSDNGHELRLGTRAIGIDEHNIVGVQLYRESDSPFKDTNPLNIKSWDEYSLYKYIEMPWLTNSVVANTLEDLEAGNFTEEYHDYRYWLCLNDPDDPASPIGIAQDGHTMYWKRPGVFYKRTSHYDSSTGTTTYTYDPFPVTGSGTVEDPYVPEATVQMLDWLCVIRDYSPNYAHRTDTIYYVRETNTSENTDDEDIEQTSRRYIWNPTANEYQPMFLYFNDDIDHAGTSEAPPAEGDVSKAYVVYIVDNELHQIFGKLYQWKESNRVHLPMSYDEGSHQYDDHSDFNVNAVTASAILSYYAAKQTSHPVQGYFYNGAFYSDPDHQNAIIPSSRTQDIYEDITYPEPHMLYTYSSSTYTPYNIGYGTSYSREDLIPFDLNQDGHINAIDASTALNYYTARATHDPLWDEEFYERYGQNPTKRDYLSYYLEKIEHLEIHEENGYVAMRTTDENGSFIPGLDIDVNEYQGLTTKMMGDIKKTIGVKVYDTSAGYEVQGKQAEVSGAYAKRGGLRFTTEGFLSVRVNELNEYNATTPEGRQGSDLQSTGLDDGEKIKSTGAKGLMIYPSNVTGVQLTPAGENDNSELCFDEYGSLHISPQYHGGGGGGELLTITDGTNTITYNGSTAQTITLGPGLMIEPDPTPNP